MALNIEATWPRADAAESQVSGDDTTVMQRRGPTRPALLAALAGAALLVACAVTRADPPTPATAPDQPDRLTAGELERLTRIAERLGRRRWGPPVIERFDQPADKAKDPWKAHGAGLVRKDGKLCLDLPANRRSIVWVQRPIDPQLVKAEGLRIDAWVDMGGAGQPFPRAAVYLATDNQQAMRWDYTFYFAYTNLNMQRLQLAGRFLPSFGAVQPRDKDKIHVVMELFDKRIRCWFDDQPVADEMVDGPVKLAAKTVVGFTCMGDSVRVIQLSLRPLAAKDAKVDPAELARASSFDGPDELTAFLKRKVIPRLSSRDFAVRRETSRLLDSLMPLSQPAVKSALAGARDPEARMRLEQIQQLAGMSDVDPPTDLKPPGAEKEPSDPKPNPPPTTQPDSEA